MGREPGAFGAHPLFDISDKRLGSPLPRHQPVASRIAIDRPLDGKQLVGAANRINRQRRFPEVGLLEEAAPAVAPARRLGDRAGFPVAAVELAEPGMGIGLQNAGITGQMAGGMTWKGAGGWVIFSNDRQVELLAHGLDRLPLRARPLQGDPQIREKLSSDLRHRGRGARVRARDRPRSRTGNAGWTLPHCVI